MRSSGEKDSWRDEGPKGKPVQSKAETRDRPRRSQRHSRMGAVRQHRCVLGADCSRRGRAKPSHLYQLQVHEGMTAAVVSRWGDTARVLGCARDRGQVVSIAGVVPASAAT